MNILMTGGTGFIGGALVEQLQERGDTLVIFTRDRSHFDTPRVRFVSDLDDIAASETFDVFINLAGESIAGGRWTKARKAELVASRVDTTQALFALANRLDRPPVTLLSASAIGYYGSQGDEPLAEDAKTVDSFSHQLCVAWEEAARQFAQLGTRVCIVRLGVVLAASGGAMEELRKSVQFGVATWMGSGKQWLSWVHRDDVIQAMLFLIEQQALSGEFNLTAPEPVTNRGFCDEMRGQLTTLAALPIPGFLMRMAMGEMAEELLLQGQRVVPARLQEAGFTFAYPTLREALPRLLAS